MIRILEPNLNGNEVRYLLECIEENWISSQGRFVEKFEQSMLMGLKDREALAVSNGTVAIHLALVALGIGPGDEVIVPNITFGATVNAVIQSGATPVFADICPDRWNLGVEYIEPLVTSKTRAVIPVALYGSPYGISEITQWCRRRDIFVVVDAAEAVGAAIEGIDIGGWGDAVTYSFFGNKTLTTGEGGGVIFGDAAVAARARVLRDHGMSPGRRYHHEVVGFNYRLTNMQAAVGVAQYERLDYFADRRRAIVSCYKHYLRNSSECKFQDTSGVSSSNWVVALSIESEGLRSKIESALALAEVETRRCFEPMHSQPAFTKYVGRDQCFKNSRDLFERTLLVPTHINLTDNDVARICSVITGTITSD